MSTSAWERRAALSWKRLAAEQDGVVSRQQLLGLGLTVGQARARVDTGRWQRLHPGVYATFNGPVPSRARIWAALLYCGQGAVVGGDAALWLAGVRSQPPGVIDICVPGRRRVVPRPGVRVTSRRDIALLARARGGPLRLCVEDAVLDVVGAHEKPEQVIGVVLDVVQRRATTSARLRERLAQRARHRWRALLDDLLEEAADGVQSALERRYYRDVERAHGLPRGVRQRREATAEGGSRYRDVVYEEWGVVVELDGEAAHRQPLRDRRRDNSAVVGGRWPMRYGWPEVATTACEVAQEMVTVFRRQGWSESPRGCGPSCSLTPSVGTA
jgi:very-short-patch-repair endonuclease